MESNIIIVVVSDGDVGNDGFVIYEIIYGNDGGVFIINS